MILMLVIFVFSSRLSACEENDGHPWPAGSQPLVIGCVAMQLTNQELHVVCSNWSVSLPCPTPSIQDYVCTVRQPLASPNLFDGHVKNDRNFRTLQYADDFKVSAFPRFAFFTKRPTTIGLLAGHAAANGSSHQYFLLLDVESGQRLFLLLKDGEMPLWQDRKQHPPAFVTQRRDGLGLDNFIAARWRVNHAYHFVQGRYERDPATEQRLLAEKFRHAQLTAVQLKAIRKVDGEDLMDLLFPEVDALCDYVYFALRTGQQKEVDALLATLQPGLQGTVKRFCADITETEVPDFEPKMEKPEDEKL